MDMLTNIVLVGAGGTLGSHILRALIEDPDFHITILTRSESAFTYSGGHPNVRLLRCEYTLPALTSAFQSQDAVVCAVAVQHVNIQKVLLEAAEKAGVKRFVLDEFANSPTNQVGLPQFQNFSATVTKREIVAMAKSMAAANSNFTWSALATGNFIDYSLAKYPAFGFDITKRKARLIDDGTEPITASTLEDISIAVRGILRRPHDTANKYLHIRSTQATQKEILVALEQLTGESWEVDYASSQDLYDSGSEIFEKGERLGLLNLLVVQLFAKGAGRSIVVSRDASDNVLLGVKEKDIIEVVKSVLDQIADSS